MRYSLSDYIVSVTNTNRIPDTMNPVLTKVILYPPVAEVVADSAVSLSVVYKHNSDRTVKTSCLVYNRSPL